MGTSFIIIGGGTAGCVLVSRLSENPDNQVVLIEAGLDYAPDAVPDDIAASYAGRALYNRKYFWTGMTASRNQESIPFAYEQARIIGGGSSINGQVALRGAPSDFDRWEQLGATGWNWKSVLPYFRKLETDMDHAGPLHGDDGPIHIHRVQEKYWDGFTKSVTSGWNTLGYTARDDMNGAFEEGYAPVPVSHNGKERMSTAVGYLDLSVRARQNLTIRGGTEARRLILKGRRVVGVEVSADGTEEVLKADQIVLSAGALRSPWLMMKSGIGPAAQLSQQGIETVLDLPGVGQNLQDHPTVSIVCYLAPSARRDVVRHNYVNLIYSSGIEGVHEGDMVMSAICKTAWHALGVRLGALSTYVGKPYSRGSVAIDADGQPAATFNWLSDERDIDRAAESFRMMAAMLSSEEMRDSVLQTFVAGFSSKVKKIGALTLYNRLQTSIAAAAMDASALVRNQIIQRVASDGVSVDELLGDEDRLKAYLRKTATGIWHPCGTCKMGQSSDPLAVVDPSGRVHGLENLSVADASIMPEIPTTNLNIPTIMIAEKIAEHLMTH